MPRRPGDEHRKYPIKMTPLQRTSLLDQTSLGDDLIRMIEQTLSVSAGMGTTFSGQWVPAHRLRDESFLKTGGGHVARGGRSPALEE
jgi:hypothetical protein